MTLEPRRNSFLKFDQQNWKRWAERLAQIAHDAPDDVELDLKKLASKAHDCMLEVYPGALIHVKRDERSKRRRILNLDI
jgi:hypothetical protein